MPELIEKTARYIAIVAGLILLALMLLVFADVLGRYFLNAPLPYSVEVVELGMGLLVFLGVLLTTVRNGHVSVDIMTAAVGPYLQRQLRRLSYIATAGLFAIAAWQLFHKAMQFHGDGLRTQVLFMPVAPFVLIMAGGAAVTAVAAIYLAFLSPQQKRED